MKRNRHSRNQKSSSNLENGNSGGVGYGKPPRAHQFPSGKSGNPNGRPKGSKNESTILREVLTRKIKHRTGERVGQISVMEGILLRMADDALKGDTKSAAFILNRYAALVSHELPNTLLVSATDVID